MSWNKNTVSSELDVIIDTLKIHNIPYEIIELGNVRGRGLNDDLTFDGSKTKTYPIRKVITKEIVYLEHMIRTCDCDFDDYITLNTFKINEVPEKWEIEIEQCVCGDCRDSLL